MNCEIPNAVVLGLYGANALGVVRSLGVDGIPVEGFHVKGNTYPHAMHSNFLGNGNLVSSEEELLSCLIAYGQSRSEKPVIFTTGDDYALFVDRCKNSLDSLFHTPTSKNFSLERLVDKQEILKHAEQAGFEVPHSSYLHEFSRRNFASLDGHPVSFPLIAKPVNSTEGSKKDMRILNCIEDVYDLEGNTKCDMVVQEYVAGGIENHFEVHAYGSSQGVIIGGMLQKKLDCSIGSVSSGAIVKEVWIPELVVPTNKLTSAVDFQGALDFNLIKNPRTRGYALLEVNFRTSANLMLDTERGCNLPAIIYRDAIGDDIDRLIDKTLLRGDVSGKTWVSEDKLLRLVLENDISLESAIDQCRKADAHAFSYEGDPSPLLKFLAGKNQQIKSMLS